MFFIKKKKKKKNDFIAGVKTYTIGHNRTNENIGMFACGSFNTKVNNVRIIM